ncbi:hypothetical protein [Pseudonocardia kunmingensis]|uniref:hypothetical protein n=1 Tax=Pseudonocardia kunmingensis TaxID=630975 RepID=UPI001153D8C8|nr:hypothetical protein [Pseudonocardia kunmingensis]
MTASDESERRVAEALSARASGAPRGTPRPAPSGRARSGRAPSGTSLTTALLIALLAGAVLGSALALISLLAPGVLPPLG